MSSLYIHHLIKAINFFSIINIKKKKTKVINSLLKNNNNNLIKYEISGQNAQTWNVIEDRKEE